jgi:GNAT superfamily N-acetyltransferase
VAGLTARLVQELPPDRLADFYTWIEGMTLDQDREDGADFAAWLRAHARTPGDCVWAFYNAAGDLLGAASLVKQDRELLAPPGGWVIAGVNVVRQRRGQGFGRAIMAWLEDELTRRAAERGRPVPVRLQTDNPIAVRLYTSLGF